jgi:hypothetical protein
VHVHTKSPEDPGSWNPDPKLKRKKRDPRDLFWIYVFLRFLFVLRFLIFFLEVAMFEPKQLKPKSKSISHQVIDEVAQ